MNLQENIPIYLRRRTHLIDRVIDNMLPNMYPCDYHSAEHFIVGLIEEIRWFLIDDEELRNIEREDIQYYIQEYKYDELTEYYNEKCAGSKDENLQENIRRILREETSDDILAIKNILDFTVMKDYEDLICDIIVEYKENHTYKYVVEIIFFREKEPTRISDYNKYLQVKDEAKDLIKHYTNMDVWVQDAYVKQCN